MEAFFNSVCSSIMVLDLVRWITDRRDLIAATGRAFLRVRLVWKSEVTGRFVSSVEGVLVSSVSFSIPER